MFSKYFTCNFTMIAHVKLVRFFFLLFFLRVGYISAVSLSGYLIFDNLINLHIIFGYVVLKCK